MMQLLANLLLVVLCVELIASATATAEIDVENLLQKMTLRQKIGQMAQIDIAYFYDSTTQTILYDKIESFVKNYEFGSMLNSIFSGSSQEMGIVGWSASQWREFINRIQSFTQETDNAIPILYGIDSIHGGTYIYESALFPQVYIYRYIT